MKKKEIENLQRAKEITTNEVQLLQWPYFCVSTAQPNDTEVEYTEILKLNGSEIKRRWVVRCHDSFGWPGQLEADVWRSVEHVMHQQREIGVLSNPVVTTLGQIKRYMPSKWRGGTDLKRIINAIKCLSCTMVECDFFYDAREKISRNASFSLIHEWRFDRKLRKDGKEVIDRTMLLIHPDVFNNIAAFHVRPLDRGFRDCLKSWLAKRLYEVLGVKFYALRKKNVPYRTRYSRLCALLGCKRQKYLSQAKQIFGRAHRELQKNNFLEKVEWYRCTTDHRDWVIHYYPGRRAVSEFSASYFGIEKTNDPVFVEKLPEIEQKPVWMEQIDSDESSATVDVISGCAKKEVASSRKGSLYEKNIGISNLDLSSDKEHELSLKLVLENFEKITGEKRRTSGLSDAERKLLSMWKDAGVTLDIISSGIKKVVELEEKSAKMTGKPVRSIWSIDYCAWAVWELFGKTLHVNNIVQDKEKTEKKEENNQLYEQADGWEQICSNLKEWIAPKNYEQLIKEIVSSRIDGKTICLVVSDPYWMDCILSTYKNHFINASGADDLIIDVND